MAAIDIIPSQESLPAMIRKLAGAFAVLVLTATPAVAQNLSPQQQALIPMAERVLQRIDAMAADFTFSNPAGRNTGRLFVDRTGGRMRMEFDAPMNHLLIANGPRVDFLGGDGTVVNAGTQSTPLALIFGEDPTLSGDIEVMEIKAQGDDAFFAVRQKARPDDGAVILQYDRSAPGWALTGWGMVDDAGRYTRTTLSNIRYGVDLPDALFIAPKPPQ